MFNTQCSMFDIQSLSMSKKVIVYTDGACTGNPGAGGYGAVLIYNEHRKEISGGKSGCWAAATARRSHLSFSGIPA